MASGSHKLRSLASHHHQFVCSRMHQIGALFLVAATFFFTRLFDHSVVPFSFSVDQVQRSFDRVHGGPYSWPDRGYGSQLSLKIYVYDVEEIDGLKVLMYGREGKITENACLRGQWGTQVTPCFCNWATVV